MENDLKFPSDKSLEASILCEILVDPQDSIEYLNALDPSDFYFTAHRRIFDACQVLAGMADSISVVELQAYLQSAGTLDSIGGAAYLSEILDQIPPSSAEFAISSLRKLTVRRKAIEICNAGMKRAINDADATATVDYLQIESMKLDPDSGGNTTAVPVRKLCEDGLVRWEKAKATPGSMTGVPSGVGNLDHVSCGFQKTDLVILASRPSMGKTAMSIGWAIKAASSGFKVLYYSLEQSDSQLIVRAVAGRARVNSHLFKTGWMNDTEMDQIRKSSRDLARLPIWIDDTGGISVGEIRRRARRLDRTERLGIIFIDHLQLVGFTGPAENRNLVLGAITRELKSMAKELDVPVVVLSQLNRNLESRPNKRPRLSDLRESGNIEQDADLVAFIFRPEHYGEETGHPAGHTELNVAKHRDGATTTAIMRFDPKTVSFCDAANEEGEKVFFNARKV